MTEKTGWTPKEISDLTVGQINAYFEEWNKEPETTPMDIEMFNLSSGIKKVKKRN